MSRLLTTILLSISTCVFAANPAITKEEAATQAVEALDAPLYSPFIERYVLDELKQLRVDLAAQKNELVQQIVDRELQSVDRGVTYATDTITYFFYLIAASSSVLVLVGWRSIRDIKEKVHLVAEEEISRLVNRYEERLHAIEHQLSQKTRHIEENREEIELTREIQSLWLRAAQEVKAINKIDVYDQILALNSRDCEALTYKADAVLELGEPQWAVNLCLQALALDSQNAHAFFQLACACTQLGKFDDAVGYLEKALAHSEKYRDLILEDSALQQLRDYAPFKELLNIG